MSKSLVSQRVATLAAKGLIVQRRDERNRRHVRLELTEAGQAALEEIYRELTSNAERLFGILGDERARFLQSLRVLQAALAAEEALAVEETLSCEADEHAGYDRFRSG